MDTLVEMEKATWKMAGEAKRIAMEAGYGHFPSAGFVNLTGEIPRIQFALEGITRDDLGEAVYAVVHGLFSVAQDAGISVGPWNMESIVYHADSFISSKESGITSKTHDLQELFEDGNPSVSEGIVTLMVCPFGFMEIVQPYIWTPADGWFWPQPVTHITPDSEAWGKLLSPPNVN